MSWKRGETTKRVPPADDDASFEQWLAEEKAFHDEMRRRFQAGRAKALAARERLRELGRRR